MRTTVDLPDELMKKVRGYYRKGSKKSLIIKGLEKLIESAAYERLKSSAGALPHLKVDLNKLRSRSHYKKFL